MHPEARTAVVGDRAISYFLRRSPARRIWLTVSDRGIVLTLPWRMTERAGERFLREKAPWLMRQLARSVARQQLRSSQDPAFDRQRYVRLKGKARRFLTERLAHFNRLYGFSYGRVSIRNQKSRWGSCTRAGDLQFSYKLLLLPPSLADYVVVHELCHRRYLHHGPRFWQLVARAYPDHRTARRELRRWDAGIV